MNLLSFQILALLMHAALLWGTYTINYNPEKPGRRRVGWLWVGGAGLVCLGLCVFLYPEILSIDSLFALIGGVFGWGLVIAGTMVFWAIGSSLTSNPQKHAGKSARLSPENEARSRQLGNILAIGSPLGLAAGLVLLPYIQVPTLMFAAVCGASFAPVFGIWLEASAYYEGSSATYSREGVSYAPNPTSYTPTPSPSPSGGGAGSSENSERFSGFNGGSFGGGGATGSW